MAHERIPLRLVPDPQPEEPAGRDVGVLGAAEVLPGLVRAALLTRAGAVRERTQARFDAGSTDPAVVDAALREAAAVFAGQDLLGVGVAAAGVVDPAAGRIIEVNDAPALRGYPVADRLAELAGAPVRIEHRARVQVLGDRWFGAGRGRRSFASVATGEVLGVGILYEGEVLAPAGGRSGAHMTVTASGELCTCGRRGCWKTVATTRWLRERAAERGFAPEAATLAALTASGTPAAADLVARYAENLVLGLATVQQLFACGLFVLHGEALDGGEPFRALVESRLRADALGGGEVPTVVLGEAADTGALLGAAGLVLSAPRH
ncbi:ROK family protein [Streptomyces sp. P01-B04]|uniref:ROK family protein n=1 Tax=Streptomyces poriferorum TaxID=2798799 RepID=UPI001C601A8B|nr:ROK family protein [Streptomyces poriferorum]MBW5249454.1 ROK family protein [Streptomyces poriferorum]MBW5258623.1 ROK family protein [Streptomyces poriferorum]